MFELRKKIKGVVIDPGHGGTDGGAVGNSIVEKNLNLKISNYMLKRFKELGIPVSSTRTTDVALSPGARTNKIQQFYGSGDDVLVISNHINAGGVNNNLWWLNVDNKYYLCYCFIV